jgi:transcriptional regulator with XRE-family HTH domain
MTLTKPIIQIVKNKEDHNKQTMALLKQLLDNAGMNQAQLAHQLNRDKTTINRWSNDSREITFENAKKIAEILKCHPIEIYEPSAFTVLKQNCSWDGLVRDLNKDEQIKIKIPYEFSNENTKAVQMDAPGTPSDNEIWLFDIPKSKKISKSIYGNVCYMEPSDKFIKNNKKKLNTDGVIGKTNKFHPLIAFIQVTGNGKFDIVNSYTTKPLHPLLTNLQYDDLSLAVPVKARWDPILNINLK